MGASAAKMANATSNFDYLYQQNLPENVPIFSEQLQKSAPEIARRTGPGNANQALTAGQLREWILEHPTIVNDIIQSSEDDEQVKLKVKDFISLVVASNGEDDHPPTNFFISSAKYSGKAHDESAHIKCKLEVTLLESQWTMIPLFPDSVALTSSSVHFNPSTFFTQ
jgi:hypothetical protein